MKTPRLEELIAGKAMDLGDKGTMRSLYEEMAMALESPDKKENHKGVEGWRAMEEKNLAPQSPSIGGEPPKLMAWEIRKGNITPTEEAKGTFEAILGRPMDGTGEGRSIAEIDAEDMEIGFAASGRQNGKEMTSKEMMGMAATTSVGTGLKDFATLATDVSEKEPNNELEFGPSRAIKGFLKGEPAEVAKGIEEAGMGALDAVNRSLGIFAGRAPFTAFSGKESAAADLKEALGDTLRALNDLGRDMAMSELTGQKNSAEKSPDEKNTFDKVVDARHEAQKMMIDALFGGKGSKDKKERDDKEPEGKEAPKQVMEEESGSLKLAKDLAKGATYKMSRGMGLKPKVAGELAEGAASGVNKIEKGGEVKDSMKAVGEAAKSAKDIAVKYSAKALAAMPGGQLLSAALLVADAVVETAGAAVKGMVDGALGDGQAGLKENKDQGQAEPGQGGSSTAPAQDMSRDTALIGKILGSANKTLKKKFGDAFSVLGPEADAAGKLAGAGMEAGKMAKGALDKESKSKAAGADIKLDQTF